MFSLGVPDCLKTIPFACYKKDWLNKEIEELKKP